MVSLLLIVLSCATERGDVKQLTDAAAPNVQTETSTGFSIERLRQLTPPPNWRDSLPRLPWEFEVVEIDAEVVGFKLEDDSDYHVVIQQPGSPGLRMIAELIDPDCAGPAYLDQIRAAREAFEKMFGKPGRAFKKLKRPRQVRLTGVLFFDKLHGQLGAAPNGVEIHPVLELR